MNDETELRRLAMADSAALILTDLHVYQYRNAGFFGESKVVVPRGAITAVRIGWQRSQRLLGVSMTLFAIWIFFFFGPTFFTAKSEFFSSQVAIGITYGSLASAIVALLVFMFRKQKHIQIIAEGTTIGGKPKQYEAAREFCDLLLSGQKESPARLT
jgi:hypothetical protein